MKRSNRIIILLCIAVVLGGVLVVGNVYRQRTSHPTEVTAGVLYRSALPSKRQLAHLVELSIRTVVSLCAPDQPLDKENSKACQAEKQFCQEHGLEFVSIPVTALFPTDEQVRQFLTVMSRHRAGAGGAVLVHCAQGRNRTGMMVAAYRIVMEDWSGEKALKEMQDYGAKKDGDEGATKAQWVMGISRDREKWRQEITPTPTSTTLPGSTVTTQEAIKGSDIVVVGTCESVLMSGFDELGQADGTIIMVVEKSIRASTKGARLSCEVRVHYADGETDPTKGRNYIFFLKANAENHDYVLVKMLEASDANVAAVAKLVNQAATATSTSAGCRRNGAERKPVARVPAFGHALACRRRGEDGQGRRHDTHGRGGRATGIRSTSFAAARPLPPG